MNPEANIERILVRLRALLPELRERYGVDTLEVFGSRLRTDVRRESDLDLLQNMKLATEFLEDSVSVDELEGDPKTLYSVVRAIEVIGEATKRVPASVRKMDAPRCPSTG